MTTKNEVTPTVVAVGVISLLIEASLLRDWVEDLYCEDLVGLDGHRYDLAVQGQMFAFYLLHQVAFDRVLRALENPYTRILGHPTGRLLMRRESVAIDIGAVLRRAGELGVAVEHNAAPERLDLCDRDLRLAKELGCKIAINTDAHSLRDFDKMTYGVRQLRRAWLEPADVLNTRGPDEFLAALRDFL